MNVLEADIVAHRGAFTLRARFVTPLDGITAVFGPSGAGKSLLLGALAGVQRLDGGRIVLADRVLDDGKANHTPAHAREIGLVFQEARLFPHLSVRGNLEYAACRAPVGGMSLEEAARRFEIAALLDRPVRNLSGGERGRAALARALVSHPALLLLDEPFAALDGARRQAFIAELVKLNVERALPMLVVTHQIEDVAAMAARVLAMREGRIVAAGPLRDVSATSAFQAQLSARDTGVALAGEAMHRGEGSVWVRADHVLLAAEAPHGLSARHVFKGVVRTIEKEPSGARLVRLETGAGVVLSRVTADAISELRLAPGADAWAIVKAHSL